MKFFNVLRIFLAVLINVRIMASTPIFKAVHNLIAVFLIEFHNADKAFKTAKLLRVKAIQPRTIANTAFLVPFQIAIDKVLIPFHIATIAFSILLLNL